MTGPAGGAGPQVPVSTYRLQLHAGFDFAAAAAVTDYLAELGVGAVYSSPILQAAPGSTHGYDVVDPTRASDELGGEAGREALVARLRAAGLDLVVDLVPNHMSVADPRSNPWWWDVLRAGRASPYASYFDIDWGSGSGDRLLLPVLGDAPDELDRLELVDGQLAYYDTRFPLAEGTGGGGAREVHERQHYELVSWRRASAELGYRRFFDITSLAGVRVEDPAVFEATHREVLRWAAAGQLRGLRIDHPDGLADPREYLARLAEAAPHAWVVVEKILESGEQLPALWPCAGTTGYDALREVGSLFVDPAGEPALTRLYADLTGEPTDFAELAYQLKLRAATTNLRAETLRLARLLPDAGPAGQVEQALAQVLAAFDVYRTYLPEGAQVLSAAVEEAGRRRPDLREVLAAVHTGLAEVGSEVSLRFQQTSGMVMAKGVEDTAYYRYNRFVALNEVGGDPARFGLPAGAFHAACAARVRDWPTAMTALSTHDTKRSEDVRARLSVLTEIPEQWAVAVRDWAGRAPQPDANLGYLAWQTLVGAWPLPHERALAYLEKASREAKQHTSWTDPDEAYDRALREFVAAVYADDALLHDVAAFAARIAAPGRITGLAQKLVQLSMPGVPDVYQGSEVEDLSLVDPDNRRPVDYDARRALLAKLDAPGAEVPDLGEDGAAKLLVVSRALRLRRQRPEAFLGPEASYAALPVRGGAEEHAVAFLRGGSVATIVPRLPVALERTGGWGDTTVALPDGRWHDVLSGRSYDGGDLSLARVLRRFPVALLART